MGSGGRRSQEAVARWSRIEVVISELPLERNLQLSQQVTDVPGAGREWVEPPLEEME